MAQVVTKYRGGAKANNSFETVDEVIEYLCDADGYNWIFEKVNDITYSAESEEADALITLTAEEVPAFEALVEKIRANNDLLVDNDEAIGEGPVHYITGKRNTGWDYQWNPEDPHYDHDKPGNYKG